MDFTISEGKLLKYSGSGPEVVVPEGVTEIGDRAFESASGIMRITLPKGLKHIGERAFSWCSVPELDIPDSVTTIGRMAFDWSKLERIRLPKELRVLRAETFHLSQLRCIELPPQLKSIEQDAFNDCGRLEKVVLPANLEKIGPRAFSHCRSLRDINIADTKANIDDTSFDYCDGLADENGFVVINGVLYRSPAMHQNKHVVLPDTVRILNPFAMSIDRWWYYNLEETRVAGFCSKITIPETVERVMLSNKFVRELVIHAKGDLNIMNLSGCDNLQKLTVPKGTKVGRDVFGCYPKHYKHRDALQIEYLLGAEDPDASQTLPEGPRKPVCQNEPAATAKTLTVPFSYHRLAFPVPVRILADGQATIDARPYKPVSEYSCLSGSIEEGFVITPPEINLCSSLLSNGLTIGFKYRGFPRDWMSGLWKFISAIGAYALSAKKTGKVLMDLKDAAEELCYSANDKYYREMACHSPAVITESVLLFILGIEQIASYFRTEENLREIADNAARKKNGTLSRNRVQPILFESVRERPAIEWYMNAYNTGDAEITFGVGADFNVDWAEE